MNRYLFYQWRVIEFDAEHGNSLILFLNKKWPLTPIPVVCTKIDIKLFAVFQQKRFVFWQKIIGVINASLLIRSFTFPENWWNRTVTAAAGYRVYPQQTMKSLPKQATCRNLINWFIAKIVSMRLLLLLSHTTCFNRRTQRCQPVHQRPYFLAYKPVSFPDESWL